MRKQGNGVNDEMICQPRSSEDAFCNIGKLAEEIGRTADILSVLINVVPGMLSSDNKPGVNLAKSDFARPEDIFAKPENFPRNIGELTEELGQLSDILSGLVNAVPKIIQLANEANPLVKP